MDAPRADGTRVFARLFDFDFECPGCGAIYQIRRYKLVPAYNHRRAEFHCKCNLVLKFGVLMYPVSSGYPAKDQIPEDSTPTAAQAAELRRQESDARSLTLGIHLDESYRVSRANQPRNILITAVCQCRPPTTHPSCPVHSAGARQAGGAGTALGHPYPSHQGGSRRTPKRPRPARPEGGTT